MKLVTADQMRYPRPAGRQGGRARRHTDGERRPGRRAADPQPAGQRQRTAHRRPGRPWQQRRRRPRRRPPPPRLGRRDVASICWRSAAPTTTTTAELVKREIDIADAEDDPGFAALDRFLSDAELIVDALLGTGTGATHRGQPGGDPGSRRAGSAQRRSRRASSPSTCPPASTPIPAPSTLHCRPRRPHRHARLLQDRPPHASPAPSTPAASRSSTSACPQARESGDKGGADDRRMDRRPAARSGRWTRTRGPSGACSSSPAPRTTSAPCTWRRRRPDASAPAW